MSVSYRITFRNRSTGESELVDVKAENDRDAIFRAAVVWSGRSEESCEDEYVDVVELTPLFETPRPPSSKDLRILPA